MEAVLYSRWSPRPDTETESSEVQISYCSRWCVENDHKIIGGFDDPDKSGDDENRPGLWEAMALAKGRMLVVYRKDRLVRSVFLTELLHRQMEKDRITLHCVMGGNCEDTADGILHRQIRAVIDENQKRVNALRTKFAMLKYQNDGRLMSRHPPYGKKLGRAVTVKDYKGVPRQRQTLVDNPDELRAMLLMKELHDAGQSLGAIADALNAKGGRMLCRGGKWTRKGVQRALSALQSKVGGLVDAKHETT